MTKRRKWGLAAGGLAVLALAALYLSLPRLVGNALLSQARQIGLRDPRLGVVRAGWRQLTLTGITAGDAVSPALRIERVVVTYSLPALLRREIGSIRLSNLEIRIESRGQGFRFPGWDGMPDTAEAGAIPRIGRLDLEGGVLKLILADRELDIPFSARLDAVGPGYSLQASIQPFGERVGLQGTLDREFSSGTIAFAVPGMDIASLIRQSGHGASLSGRGRAAAAGEFRLRSGRFLAAKARIRSLGNMRLEVPAQGECELSSLDLAFGIGADFSVRDVVAQARGDRLLFGELAVEAPFELDVRSRRWPRLEFVVSGLDVVRPFPVFCERISGKVTPPLETARLQGDFLLQARAGLPAALGLPWVIDRPYALSGDFLGLRAAREFTWELKAGGDGAAALSAGNDLLRGDLRLDASLEGDTRQARAAVSGRLANADLRIAGARARSGRLAGDADLAFDFAGGWRGRGTLQVRDGRFLTPGDDGVRATGIALRLPWSYPGAGPGRPGHFSIARLQAGGARGRDISGVLSQVGQGISLSGQAHADLPGIALLFQGNAASRANGWDGRVEFQVPPTVLPAKAPLQALHPLLKGWTAGGRLAVRGTIRAAGGPLAGSAVLEVVDADVAHAGSELSLRGAQAAVTLDSLFDLVSAPGQQFRFSELLWQSVALSNGEIVFRLEGGGALRVESGSFAWSGGTVTIDPLRLAPGMTAMEVTLRCRDVDLAVMLNALAGEEIVSGDARLSGVIPIKLAGGGLQFLDGRLDSTPGRTGQLRVSKPEAISGGQVLVEEAIREFDYNWIKVRLDGQGDRLNMIVSIDGAPSRKLPLRYDQKKGDFVRAAAGKPGVELKGLLLDIRFIDIDLKDLLDTGGRVTAGGHKK